MFLKKSRDRSWRKESFPQSSHIFSILTVMGRYSPDPKVFGIPLLEEYIKTTPEYEMMGPHTNNVVVQYATAAFMLGEKVAESVPSRVIYVETKEGPAPCVVLASDKDHAASFETEQGRETLKKVYEIIRLEQPPAWKRFYETYMVSSESSNSLDACSRHVDSLQCTRQG
ncbi:hypothetical protein F5876DRAFT_71198 [Lentinula aff. lateritia]|uniref:Uncharacterized protein n=1 Tax=Lentinula aff. lateritia TaxID=2804960 RepID=A0ACC1TH42_9AGAR|nr:hypothetical protein F5876DRAFT_71198 [Lentinula aff. lateritia]